jgi:phage terminase small subunit
MDKRVKAPSEDATFKLYWDKFCDDVMSRDNFKSGHLEQLAILCQLYCDFYELNAEIKKTGFTYETVSQRYGNQIKVNPACTQRDKVLAHIGQYSKLLGLLLEKDRKLTDEDTDDDFK